MPNKKRRSKTGSVNYCKRKNYVANNNKNNNDYCRECETLELIDYGDFNYDSNDDHSYNEAIDSDEEPDIIEIEQFKLSDEETNFSDLND